MKSFAARILRQLLPLSAGIAIAALCLLLKENFPFTHYPMYSDFSDQTYYVWVADRDGHALPIQKLTALRTGRIKKVYNKHLLQIREDAATEDGKPRKRDLTPEQRLPAGEETLRWLYESSPPELHAEFVRLSPIRLYQTNIRIDGDKVIEDPPMLVGTFAIPPQP